MGEKTKDPLFILNRRENTDTGHRIKLQKRWKDKNIEINKSKILKLLHRIQPLKYFSFKYLWTESDKTLSSTDKGIIITFHKNHPCKLEY